MSDLLSVNKAQRLVLEAFAALDGEYVPIANAYGRVLAAEIKSAIELPPFNNSSMDGFAVRVADLEVAGPEHPVRLQVIADIPAGRVVDVSLETGQAARIMTGAYLPAGAEAVVPVEDTNFQTRQPGSHPPQIVEIYRPVSKGENIRPSGQDVRAGEMVLSAGTRLLPEHIGFLAMLGIPEAFVHRRPRVAIFSTGDELLPVGSKLEPGKIFDSNSYTLTSLVEKYHGEVVSLGVAPDREEAVQAILESAAYEGVDLILSSAGVSVGAFDFVKEIVEKRGRLGFWRVNMRPGKPLAFGNYQGIPFIGLPGNPVSAFIGFLVFVRPALLKMQGLIEYQPRTQQATLLEDILSDGRESYLRAVVTLENNGWTARLTGHQGSGNLRSLVQANALLLVPSGVKSLPIGSKVEAWMLDD